MEQEEHSIARGKKHTAEQIVNLLRQVEVGVANGNTLPQARKEAEIVEQTYYRWRKEYRQVHTWTYKGSISVALRTKEALVGDLVASSISTGGVIRTRHTPLGSLSRTTLKQSKKNCFAWLTRVSTGSMWDTGER